MTELAELQHVSDISIKHSHLELKVSNGYGPLLRTTLEIWAYDEHKEPMQLWENNRGGMTWNKEWSLTTKEQLESAFHLIRTWYEVGSESDEPID